MQDRMDALLRRALPGPWRRRVSVAAALVLVYALLGFFLVPALIRRQVVARSAERLHRAATVAKVRVNPFTLETRLIGFDLRDRDDTPLAAFDTLVVNLELASLVRRALVLKEFRLVRPVVTARILPDGHPAIADLFEADSAAPPDTTPPALPRLVVRVLSISGGTINFRDESRTPVYAELFEDLGLTLDGFSTLPRGEGDHLLTVRFASGASVQWSGSVVMQPLTLRGRVVLEHLRLPRISRVLGDRLPLTVTEGEGAATLDYLVDQSAEGRMRLALQDARLDFTGVAMRPPGAEEDWFRVQAVAVRGVRAAWPRRTYEVDSVAVTAPWIGVTRAADSTLNWTAVLDAFAARDTASADSAPPWTGIVRSVRVDSGAVRFVDRVVQPAVTFDLGPVDARIDSVRSDSAAPFSVTARAALAGGGSATVQGSLIRSPVTADLAVALTGVQLARFQPYLGPESPIRIDSGQASVAGRLRRGPGRPASTFDGSAAIEGLETVSPDGERLLGWRSLRATGLHVTTDPDLARIRKVEVEEPFVRISISREREVNLAALKSIRRDTTGTPFPYELVELTLSNAEVDFTDLSLVIPFRTRIHAAAGSLTDVASFGGTSGALEFEGSIEEDGRARATGTIHLSHPYRATEIHADFRNVSLPSLTPYSLEFAGYPITRGRLDVAMDYKIQDGQLTANHHIVASDLELGEKAEGGAAPGFAVKLALSLLKDSQGKIKLDALVEGKVDDPQFRYSAVVWQVLKQMLGKIATAPFRFLGNLLGIGGDDLELVDFDPGSAVVIAPERTKLDTLASAVGQRPELQIGVEGRYDSIADLTAFREASLRGQIEARREASAKRAAAADTSATALGLILEDLYRVQFPGPSLDSLKAAFPADTLRPAYFAELRSRLLAAQPVAPGQLEALGRARGEAISAALLATGRLTSSQVTIGEPAPVKRKKSGSARVASELTMDAE